MLRIRLRRVGKKKQPQYRLVIADSHAPRDGAFIETVGTYNPLTDPATITLKEDSIKGWLSKGAVPSERAVKILASQGLVPAPVYAPKAKKAKPEAEAAAPAAAAPKAEKPADEAPAAEAPAEAAPAEAAADAPAEEA
jgi:small subunit ribosomal protein S16